MMDGPARYARNLRSWKRNQTANLRSRDGEKIRSDDDDDYSRCRVAASDTPESNAPAQRRSRLPGAAQRLRQTCRRRRFHGLPRLLRHQFEWAVQLVGRFKG